MNRLYNLILLTSIGLMAFSLPITGQTDAGSQHTEVVMRMIGHEVLLSSGDSTTRVLPITKPGKNLFEISFESRFAFTPDSLASTIDGVISKSGISTHYIVEIENCGSRTLVYSYEVGNTIDSTLFPCSQRSYPDDCYTILITLLDTENHVSAGIVAGLGNSGGHFSDSPGTTFSNNALWSGLILVLITLFVLVLRKRRRAAPNPNLISIGKYHFDKLNSELLFENQRIELTGKEADLLLLLHDTVNTTVEREIILKLIWGDNGDYIGRTLDVFISKLRKKLESDPRIKIVNIRGVGYKLVMDGIS